MVEYTSPEDISPEREDEIIERVFRFIKKFPGLEVAAVMFLEANKPMSYIFGEIGRFSITPFTVMLTKGERDGLSQFITVFEQRDNIERLIKNIEEMKPEKKEEEKMKKTSIFERIKSIFR